MTGKFLPHTDRAQCLTRRDRAYGVLYSHNGTIAPSSMASRATRCHCITNSRVRHAFARDRTLDRVTVVGHVSRECPAGTTGTQLKEQWKLEIRPTLLHRIALEPASPASAQSTWNMHQRQVHRPPGNRKCLTSFLRRGQHLIPAGHIGNTFQPLREGRKVPRQPPDPVRAVTHQSGMDRAGASRRNIDTRIFSTRERPRWPHHAEGLEGLFRFATEQPSPAEPIPNRAVHRSPQTPYSAMSAFGQERPLNQPRRMSATAWPKLSRSNIVLVLSYCRKRLPRR